MKNIKFLFALFLFAPAAFSQKERAIEELNKMTKRYQKPQFLSFKIQYKYSDSEKPGEYLDSLDADFKLNGNRYWYEIANIRTVADGENTVVVYNDDSIIYLSKSALDVLPAGIVGMTDSLFSNADVAYSIEDHKKTTIINIGFSNDSRIKQVGYEIDNRSGLLRKVLQVVNAKYMYDPSLQHEVEDADKYVVVETLFSDYSEKPFNQEIFNTANYIQKIGQDYVARSPYQSYKIFLGNPHL